MSLRLYDEEPIEHLHMQHAVVAISSPDDPEKREPRLTIFVKGDGLRVTTTTVDLSSKVVDLGNGLKGAALKIARGTSVKLTEPTDGADWYYCKPSLESLNLTRPLPFHHVQLYGLLMVRDDNPYVMVSLPSMLKHKYG